MYLNNPTTGLNNVTGLLGGITYTWSTYQQIDDVEEKSMFHDYNATPPLLKMQFTFNPSAESWARNSQPVENTDGGFCVQWWDSDWTRGELFAMYSKDMLREKDESNYQYYN